MNSAPKLGPNEVFLNVRKAYRLLHEYQGMVLDAVRYIDSQLNMDGYCAYQLFAAGVFTDGTQILKRPSWVWLPMYNCVFRFWKGLPDDKCLSLSFFVISDTGFIERAEDTSNKERLSDFALPDQSSTKFAFILHKDIWDGQVPPFMSDRSQMKNFMEKNGTLPEDLIKAGIVGKCYDMSCLTSESTADEVIKDVIAFAQANSWPIEYKNKHSSPITT